LDCSGAPPNSVELTGVTCTSVAGENDIGIRSSIITELTGSILVLAADKVPPFDEKVKWKLSA
jgi:hypothetical protein